MKYRVAMNLGLAGTLVLLSATENVSAKDSTPSLWETISQSTESVLKLGTDQFSSFIGGFQDFVNQELERLNQISDRNGSNVDLREKIDTLRLKVDEIAGLKAKEEKASTFTLLSMSKKDYRIEIDEVLANLEEVLFDGEVVDYAAKIRRARDHMLALKDRKAKIKEDIIFSSAEKSFFNSTRSELESELEDIDKSISSANRLIDELEFDLKRKLNSLGIKVTRDQIRVLTTRVDGDDMAKTFAVFDLTRQISQTLQKLVEANSFSSSTTVRYYGTYVILSEILGYTQREYINKIDDIYLPALDIIESDIESAIEFAEDKESSAKLEVNAKIFRSNIESNILSLNIVDQYRKILLAQKSTLENALESTNEQIAIAYSTYDTASNSANLVNLIDQTQNSFNQIMNLQLPELIPFENIELEERFGEISGQIVSQVTTE